MANRRRGAFAALAVLSALLLGLVAACQNGGSSASSNLLNTSAAAMRSVTSVHFTLTVTGTLSGVPLQSAQGDLNSQGQAKGTAKLSELGQLVQVDFVLYGGTLYIKGPTGGYQKISATLAGALFDPSAILDPNRGVAKVLSSVTGMRTADQETVDGVATYKITGTVAGSVVSKLIPGLSQNVGTTVWVTTDARHLPVQASFAVPGTDGAQGATVLVTLSNLNAPVSVTPPTTG